MQGSQQFGSMSPQQGSMPATVTAPMPQIHLGQGGQNQMSMSPGGAPGSLPHIQGYQYGGSGFPTAGGNFSQMGGMGSYSAPQPTQNWQGWQMSGGQMSSPFQTSNLPYNLPSGGSDGQNTGGKVKYTLDGKMATPDANMNFGAQNQTWTSTFQGANPQATANMLPTGNYSFNMPRN